MASRRLCARLLTARTVIGRRCPSLVASESPRRRQKEAVIPLDRPFPSRLFASQPAKGANDREGEGEGSGDSDPPFTVDSPPSEMELPAGNESSGGLRQSVEEAFSDASGSFELETKDALSGLRVGGLLAGVVGTWYAWYQAKKTWNQREFHNLVTFSLNTIGADGVLRFRTILEREVEDILRHPNARRLLTQAKSHTSDERPFLELPSDDAWFITNPFLNAIAEVTAPGFVAQDLGLPVTKDWYVFGITNEREV
jgi:hypothetical protein